MDEAVALYQRDGDYQSKLLPRPGFGQGVVEGLTGMGGSIVSGAGAGLKALTGEDYGLTQLGQDIANAAGTENFAPTSLTGAIRGDAPVGASLKHAAGQIVGSLVPLVAGGLLGRAAAGVAGATGAVVGADYLSQLGEGAQTAENLQGAPITQSQAQTLAAGAVPAAAVDLAGLAPLARIVRPGSLLGKAMAGKTLTGSIGKGVATEAVSEGGSQAITTAAAERATGIEMDPQAKGRMLLEAGLVGGLAGGAFGTAGHVFTGGEATLATDTGDIQASGLLPTDLRTAENKLRELIKRTQSEEASKGLEETLSAIGKAQSVDEMLSAAGKAVFGRTEVKPVELSAASPDEFLKAGFQPLHFGGQTLWFNPILGGLWSDPIYDGQSFKTHLVKPARLKENVTELVDPNLLSSRFQNEADRERAFFGALFNTPLEKMIETKAYRNIVPGEEAPAGVVGAPAPAQAPAQAPAPRIAARPVKKMAMRYSAPAEWFTKKVRNQLNKPVITTSELMRAGLRTATTRSDGYADVGDRVMVPGVGLFEVVDKRKTRMSDPAFIKEWNELEGWDYNAIKQAAKQGDSKAKKLATQIENGVQYVFRPIVVGNIPDPVARIITGAYRPGVKAGEGDILYVPGGSKVDKKDLTRILDSGGAIVTDTKQLMVAKFLRSQGYKSANAGMGVQVWYKGNAVAKQKAPSDRQFTIQGFEPGGKAEPPAPAPDTASPTRERVPKQYKLPFPSKPIPAVNRTEARGAPAIVKVLRTYTADPKAVTELFTNAKAFEARTGHPAKMALRAIRKVIKGEKLQDDESGVLRSVFGKTELVALGRLLRKTFNARDIPTEALSEGPSAGDHLTPDLRTETRPAVYMAEKGRLVQSSDRAMRYTSLGNALKRMVAMATGKNLKDLRKVGEHTYSDGEHTYQVVKTADGELQLRRRGRQVGEAFIRKTPDGWVVGQRVSSDDRIGNITQQMALNMVENAERLAKSGKLDKSEVAGGYHIPTLVNLGKQMLSGEARGRYQDAWRAIQEVDAFLRVNGKPGIIDKIEPNTRLGSDLKAGQVGYHLTMNRLTDLAKSLATNLKVDKLPDGKGLPESPREVYQLAKELLGKKPANVVQAVLAVDKASGGRFLETPLGEKMLSAFLRKFVDKARIPFARMNDVKLIEEAIKRLKKIGYHDTEGAEAERQVIEIAAPQGRGGVTRTTMGEAAEELGLPMSPNEDETTPVTIKQVDEASVGVRQTLGEQDENYDSIKTAYDEAIAEAWTKLPPDKREGGQAKGPSIKYRFADKKATLDNTFRGKKREFLSRWVRTMKKVLPSFVEIGLTFKPGAKAHVRFHDYPRIEIVVDPKNKNFELAMAHEMGHVIFRTHIAALLDTAMEGAAKARKPAEELLKSALGDELIDGVLKELKSKGKTPEKLTALDEAFAHRFSAWYLRRVEGRMSLFNRLAKVIKRALGSLGAKLGRKPYDFDAFMEAFAKRYTFELNNEEELTLGQALTWVGHARSLKDTLGFFEGGPLPEGHPELARARKIYQQLDEGTIADLERAALHLARGKTADAARYLKEIKTLVKEQRVFDGVRVKTGKHAAQAFGKAIVQAAYEQAMAKAGSFYRKAVGKVMPKNPEAAWVLITQRLDKTPSRIPKHVVAYYGTLLDDASYVLSNEFASAKRLNPVARFTIPPRIEEAARKLMEKDSVKTLRGIVDSTADILYRSNSDRLRKYGVVGEILDRYFYARPDIKEDRTSEMWIDEKGNLVRLKTPHGIPLYYAQFNQAAAPMLRKASRILGAQLTENQQKALRDILWEERPIAPGVDTKVAEVAMALRKLMRSIAKDMKERYGIEVKLRKHYFPKVLRRELIAQDKEGAIKRLMQHAGMTLGEAKRLVEDLAAAKDTEIVLDIDQVMEESKDGLLLKLFPPSFRHLKGRKLDESVRNALRPYYEDDLNILVRSYIHSAYKRGVFSYLFGEDVHDPETGAVYRRATKRLEDLINRGVEYGYITKTDADEILRIHLPAYLGTLGQGRMNPALIKAQSYITTGLNFMLLSMSVLSSFSDLAGIDIATNKSFLGVRKAIATLRNKEGKVALENLLKEIGIIRDDMTEKFMLDSITSDYMHPTAHQWNEAFFRAVQLKRWTDFTRTVAAGVGIDMIRAHATAALKGDAKAKKMMAAYGIADPKLVIEWLAKGRPAGVERYTSIYQAIEQFVDTAIIRPHPGNRPVWMSDPRFMLVAHLKGFIFAFHHTIIKQIASSVTSAKGLAKLTPVMFALAMYLPLAAVGYELRWMLTRTLPADLLDRDAPNHPTGMRYVWELATRAGFPGAASIVYDAYEAEQHGQFWLVSLVPAASKLRELTWGLDYFLARSVPVVSQSPVASKALREQLQEILP